MYPHPLLLLPQKESTLYTTNPQRDTNLKQNKYICARHVSDFSLLSVTLLFHIYPLFFTVLLKFKVA